MAKKTLSYDEEKFIIEMMGNPSVSYNGHVGYNEYYPDYLAERCLGGKENAGRAKNILEGLKNSGEILVTREGREIRCRVLSLGARYFVKELEMPKEEVKLVQLGEYL